VALHKALLDARARLLMRLQMVQNFPHAEIENLVSADSETGPLYETGATSPLEGPCCRK
jgi:hypothetical protein